MILVYDGSLCGYLCALEKGMERPDTVEDLLSDEAASGFLLGDFFHVASDPAGEVRFQKRIKTLSSAIYGHLLYAWLAETEGCEMLGFRYLCAALNYGKSADSHLADPAILAMTKLVMKVGGERHRMMGLLRFSEAADGTFYAPFEPDHNITALVAGHFAARIPDRDWIIHDVKRGIAAVFRASEHRYEVVTGELSAEVEYTQEELRYRELWRSFHKTIAIGERTNPNLQKRFMPSRYWKHLTEKNI